MLANGWDSAWKRHEEHFWKFWLTFDEFCPKINLLLIGNSLLTTAASKTVKTRRAVYQWGIGTAYKELCRYLQQLGTKGYQGERNRSESKNILWVFVFGSRTAQNCALCHYAIGAHFPTSRSATISRFPYNFFPKWPLDFFVIICETHFYYICSWPARGNRRWMLFAMSVNDPSLRWLYCEAWLLLCSTFK